MMMIIYIRATHKTATTITQIIIFYLSPKSRRNVIDTMT